MNTAALMRRCDRWCESFTWLRVETRGEHIVLICTTCPYNTSWAKGRICRPTTQRSDLVDHVESVKHKEGVLWNAQQPMVEGLRKMTKRAAEREAADATTSMSMSYSSWSLHAAKVAHFINKKSLSFSLMSDMCALVHDCVVNNLEEKVDPDIFRDGARTPGDREKPMYANAKAAAEYATILADLEIKATVQGIQEAGCYGLAVDEGTDVSISKVLALSVRYVCMDAGSIINRSLGLVELAGGTSDDVHSAILSKLAELGLSDVPLVGFSSDGASVMVGATNGVATKLKATYPFMVATHCAAHRLNLAARKISSPPSDNVEDLATRLFGYFSRSSTRISNLGTTAERLDVKFLRLARPADTRWLSLGEAVKTIVRMYPALVAFLATESSAIARKIHAAMIKMPVKFTIFFVADLLQVLNNLSLLLQANDVSIFDVRQHVMATCATLDAMAKTDLHKPATSTHLRAFVKEYLGDDVSAEEKERRIMGLRAWVEECSAYASQVSSGIRARFPEETASVVNAFECLFPHSMVCSAAARMEFGLDSFEFLHSTFFFLLPESEGYIEEFQRYKSYVINHWPLLAPAQFLQASLSNHYLRRSCPIAHKLLTISATLPMTSVECERYFSIMKRIKTDTRNRLSVETTSKLLIAAIDASAVEDFAPYACIREFQERKKRQREADLDALDALDAS